MKKLICFISIMITILCGSIIVNAEDFVDVYINGEKLDTDQPAIIYQDRTMVPLRAICEAMGCDVEWNEETQSITVSNPLVIVGLQINNYTISIRNRDYDYYKENPHMIHDHEYTATTDSYIPIDVPPIIENGRTLVPARALSEAFHAIVDYIPGEKSVLIETEYDFIGPFIEHYAEYTDYNGNLYGFHYEPLARVCKNGKWGYINISGGVHIPLEYDWAEDYSTNSFYDALVMKDGRYGFIGRDGIGFGGRYYYEDAYSFGEYDVTLVKINGKWGGRSVSSDEFMPDFPFIYDDALPFSEELAAVKKGNKWGYVDLKGQNVIPFNYDDASNFWNGMAIVAKTKRGKNQYGIIDKNNKIIIPLMYNDIWPFVSSFSEEQYAPAMLNGKWGIINNANKTVLEFIYDDIGGFDEDCLILYKDGEEICVPYDEIDRKLQQLK